MVGTGIDVTETRRWVEERVEGEARLRHIADHDALTGLFNRRRFEEELERHIAHGRRYGMSGALLLLDLDGFKQVNDTHGHRTGDRVLTRGGGRAAPPAAGERRHRALRRRRVRRADAGRGRDGGRVSWPSFSARPCTRDVGTPAGPLSASVGIAVLDASSTPDDLLSRADDAMYAEKRTSRPAVRRLRSVE